MPESIRIIATDHEDSRNTNLSFSISDCGQSDKRDIELTIFMPCLNEAETIQSCIRKAIRFLDESGVSGEVLVEDNGSSEPLAAQAVELFASLKTR